MKRNKENAMQAKQISDTKHKYTVYPEDGVSIFFLSVHTEVPNYTMSQAEKPLYEL
jgi:hypothetical protein